MQEQVYKTEAGDTWDLIAFKLFGNENLMKELLEENIELSEIVIFPAGVELSIPEIKVGFQHKGLLSIRHSYIWQKQKEKVATIFSRATFSKYV